MTKKTTTEAKTAPAHQKQAADVISSDEFAGKGGSYIFDPTTGTRSPAPQPEETPVQTEKE